MDSYKVICTFSVCIYVVFLISYATSAAGKADADDEFFSRSLSKEEIQYCRDISLTSNLSYENLFYDIAVNDSLISDKVTSHFYQVMYGMFLYPYVYLKHMHGDSIKLMEIGLGCTQAYGAGASVNLWQRLMSIGKTVDNGVITDQIWEAEVLTDCVLEHIEKSNTFSNINLLLGDQGNIDTLNSWIKGSGGNFDIIIDDGSHRQHDIYTSFNVLWRNGLKPGGLYFLEDLHVSRVGGWYADVDTNRNVVMIEVVKDWVEQLVATVVPDDDYIVRYKHKLPPMVKWIFCQHEACVLAKCDESDLSPNCLR